MQNSAQVEIDLDQTAALLCQEMQEAAERDITVFQLRTYLAWEREHRDLAMAAVSTLNAQLQHKDCELQAALDENCRSKVCLLSSYNWLKHVKHLMIVCQIIIPFVPLSPRFIHAFRPFVGKWALMSL